MVRPEGVEPPTYWFVAVNRVFTRICPWFSIVSQTSMSTGESQRFRSPSSCPRFTLFSQGGTPQNAPCFLARSTRVPFPARMGSVASFEEPCQSASIQQTSPASRPLAPENLAQTVQFPKAWKVAIPRCTFLAGDGFSRPHNPSVNLCVRDWR